ncbi:MAG: transporter [Nitrosomonas sp.]|nr:MAG: transporter [Nitrosomonas sp.]
MTEKADKQAVTTQKEDTAQQIDFDLGVAMERIDNWIDEGIRLLPNIVLAIIILVLVYIVSNFAHRIVKRQFSRRDRDNLGEMLSSFVKWTIIIIGSLVAATIVIPSLKPGDLIAGLGISSVAIGFAFKDILQNWLAGLLLLLRQPFQIGDQIEVNGHEGTVEHIETRATIIKTYDGQRIVMPNSTIYTNAVIVKSAYEKQRSQYDVGIGYNSDIDEACAVIKQAIDGIPGIESDPPPVIVPWNLAASWVTIRVQWWRHTKQNAVMIQAAVLKAIKQALDKAEIDMPYETRVQLFHDQTGSAEGDNQPQDKKPSYSATR